MNLSLIEKRDGKMLFDIAGTKFPCRVQMAPWLFELIEEEERHRKPIKEAA